MNNSPCYIQKMASKMNGVVTWSCISHHTVWSIVDRSSNAVSSITPEHCPAFYGVRHVDDPNMDGKIKHEG